MELVVEEGEIGTLCPGSRVRPWRWAYWHVQRRCGCGVRFVVEIVSYASAGIGCNWKSFAFAAGRRSVESGIEA